MPTPQKIRCQVAAVTDHGDRVFTVLLQPERPVPRFQAGQFLHLALDDYDPSGFWPDSRVFSIASSPAERQTLRISYSVRGRFTTRMERELAVSHRLWVKMPYGDFVISPGRDVVLLAGGTGITAFTAFLENLTPQFPGSVYLAYGARHRRLMIYRDQVCRQANALPQLRPFFFVEQTTEPLPADDFIGCISMASVWPKLRDPFNTTYYISGPPLMIKALMTDLQSRNIPQTAIRIDAWE